MSDHKYLIVGRIGDTSEKDIYYLIGTHDINVNKQAARAS